MIENARQSLQSLWAARPITDPVLIFAVLMMIVLIAPRLASRAKLTGLAGLIIAGAVVGPTGLNLLELGFTMQLLGKVGLLYLMFSVGLELDLNLFAKVRYRSVVFGLLSFILPAGATFAVGYTFLSHLFPPEVLLPSALLVGTIAGSHTLLAYPIASRLGITKHPAVMTVTGGTFVTETVALVGLSIVEGLTFDGGLTTAFWVRFLLAASIYTALVLVIIPRLGRWFFRNVVGQPHAEFLFLMSVLFVTAYLAHFAQLEPILGAFLAGLAINRQVPRTSVLMNRWQFIGDALFIPIFLVSVGMRVDFAALVSSLDTWAIALLLLVCGSGGKLVAAKFSQLVFRHKADQGWVMGGLSMSVAAVALAVALVGTRLGLFTGTHVNATIIFILVTCLIGPMLVERFGRRMAAAQQTEPYKLSEAPQRILVPLANPSLAGRRMDLALALREPQSPEPIYPLVVARDGQDVQAQVAQAEAMLGDAVVHAAAADVPVQAVTRVDMSTMAGMLRAIKELRISTIVMGWSGRTTAGQWVFGSLVDQLLQQTQQMVVVSRMDNPLNTTRRVLLLVPPLAFREPGFAAAVRAVKLLANHLSTKVVLLCVRHEQDDVRKRVKSVRPEAPVEVVSIELWSLLPDTLTRLVSTNDLLVSLSARMGRLSWQPALNRLPRALARQFPGNDFLIIYPTEVVVEAAPSAPATPAEATLGNGVITAERVSLGLNELTSQEAIQRMLGRAFPGQARLMDVMQRALMGGDRERVLEVTRGVVLLHAHVGYVDESTVLLGLSETGLRFTGIDEAAHVVFVLLSPQDQPAEKHLQALASIARLVREPDTIKRLRSARSAEQVLSLVGGPQANEAV